jgi:two-component system NarL family response regulator
MRRLKLLIAEDHPLMVEAIRAAVSVDGRIEIVGIVSPGADVIEAALAHDPDIILLDLRMPEVDGITALYRLRAARVRAKRVVLSGAEGPDVVRRAFEAGAAAFINKRIDPYDLAAALRQACEQTLFQPFKVNPLLADATTVELTEREAAILTGLVGGLSNKQIASRLSYAEQTVKLELTRLYRKLGVSSRTEAIAVALRTGLIETAGRDASRPGELITS